MTIVVEPVSEESAAAPIETAPVQQSERDENQPNAASEGLANSQPPVISSAEHHADGQFEPDEAPGQANEPPHVDSEVPPAPVARATRRILRRLYTVSYSKMHEALLWLKENNPFYEPVHIDTDNLNTELQPDDPQEQMTDAVEQQLMHTVMLDNQPAVAYDAVAQAVRPRLTLARNNNAALSSHTTKGIEAMSFIAQFPTGQNHFGAVRLVPISNSMYFRTRVLSADIRCLEAPYVLYLLSQYQHLQLKNGVQLALRWVSGAPTVQQVRERAQQQRDPDHGEEGNMNGEKCWAFLQQIRGTAAYWNRSAKDLFAMYRAIGPATWFLTLSANDCAWEDLNIVVEALNAKRENREPMSANDFDAHFLETPLEDRKEQFLKNQVIAARHFANKWRIFSKKLFASTWLGGKVKDYFWRTEFQKRGSPHLHMLIWIEGAPDHDTEAGRESASAFIDSVVSTRIPEESEDPEQKALRYLVLTGQQHRHTDTCKRQHMNCRFKYPRRLSRQTRLLGPGETGPGVRKCDFYLTERHQGEENTVPWNKDILLHWQANMDLQLVGTAHATNVYVGGYMTKSETEGLQESVQHGLEALPEGSSARRRLFRIGTSVLKHRHYSLQEALYLLSGLQLRGSSKEIVSINASIPEKRNHLIDTSVIGDASEQGDEAARLKLTKFEFYAHRQPSMENTTFADFVRSLSAPVL